MKVILISAVTIVVIAVVASFGLDQAGYSSQEQQSGSSVRLD